MRMSCNGCRILRKGCTHDCTIKPCLEWIRSPESQSNATVFLAKFYGRAGLLKLISAAPERLRPGVFRSLMYEACGRIVNPVYGSVGLLWSGSWQLCQNAVEAVLQGNPIIPIASDAAETNHGPPFKAYDIRHITKNENSAGSSGVRRARTKAGVKRARPATSGKGKEPLIVKEPWLGTILESSLQKEMSSHGSGLSHQSEVVEESMVSVETSPAKMKTEVIGKINLELTLGNKPVKRAKTKKEIVENTDAGDWLALRLGFPA